MKVYFIEFKFILNKNQPQYHIICFLESKMLVSFKKSNFCNIFASFLLPFLIFKTFTSFAKF